MQLNMEDFYLLQFYRHGALFELYKIQKLFKKIFFKSETIKIVFKIVSGKSTKSQKQRVFWECYL